MTETNLQIPDLKLSTPAPSAPSVGSIQQTLSPAPAEKEEPAAMPMLDDSQLTDAERQAIDTFIGKLDLTNPDHVLLYGADAQKKVAAFSDSALAAVKTQDTGEVGDMLVGLVQQLKSFDKDTDSKPAGLFGKLFAKPVDKLERMKASYAKVSVNVESIAGSLEGYQTQLLKDVAMFDRLYDVNNNYFHELTLYIIAGDKYLAQVRSKDLKELQEIARKSGDAMDAQKANDLAAQCDRFEKKLHDLQLTRTVAMQTGPQIRMIQAADQMMAEKIQSTIVNTIPLWKNQMVIAIGIEHANQAAKAEREVNDMTNALLRKNAEKLKQATVETAKEAERGIVDIETLKHTNEMLISTMDEVMAIQAEGKQKRAAAERDLAQIEQQLREKLLQASRS